MSETFVVFIYGTLNKANASSTVLQGCDRIGPATVHGTLYVVDGNFPAIMLYGDTPVAGVLWRCPVERLPEIDAYKGTAKGLFRRIGTNAIVEENEVVVHQPCWIYVAGPALARKLTPDARARDGRWTPT
jgi:gamma-glutamylcyclotransferase (GGCT)/AIG2-like uncharacterized protein YtfP